MRRSTAQKRLSENLQPRPCIGSLTSDPESTCKDHQPVIATAEVVSLHPLSCEPLIVIFSGASHIVYRIEIILFCDPIRSDNFRTFYR